MDTIWIISISIILFTVLVLIYIKANNIEIPKDYIYLSTSIGLAALIFAALGEGVFIHE